MSALGALAAALGRRVRNRRDFALGAGYALTGAAFAAAAAQHEMGEPARIGPGFFPFWLGVVLAGLGAVTMARSAWRGAAATRVGRWDLRAIAWMSGAMLLFAMALRPLGLALAVLLLVVASSAASDEFRWRTTLLNAAVLVVLTVGGFVFGLALPLPVWPALVAG